MARSRWVQWANAKCATGCHFPKKCDCTFQRKQAESYVLHSLFDDFTLQNDICLIKTTEPFTFNEYVSLLIAFHCQCIALFHTTCSQVKAMNSPMGEGQNFDDTTAVMVGWGSPAPNQDYSSVLLSATVDVVDDTSKKKKSIYLEPVL